MALSSAVIADGIRRLRLDTEMKRLTAEAARDRARELVAVTRGDERTKAAQELLKCTRAILEARQQLAGLASAERELRRRRAGGGGERAGDIERLDAPGTFKVVNGTKKGRGGVSGKFSQR